MILDVLSNNEDKIQTLFILLITSIYIRVLLQLMGQNWIKTIAHTATLTLLPILTYVITNVISGNIALSLGMVGALSIVRFRNPVRSPLELSVYFGSITMGIAASVSSKWLLFLIIAASLVCFLLYTINILSLRLLGKPFFITSFSEGNFLSSLTVVSKNDIEELNSHECLSSKVKQNNQVTYSFVSSDFKRLQDLEQYLSSKSSVISIQLSK